MARLSLRRAVGHVFLVCAGILVLLPALASAQAVSTAQINGTVIEIGVV